MKILSSSPWSTAGLASAITLVAVASCGGIQERLEVLRAERVEIVDDKGGLKMDLEKQIKLLEERIARLEAAAAAPARVEPAGPQAPVAPVAPAVDAGTQGASAPDAASRPNRRPPPSPPPSAPTNPKTEIF